MPEQKREWVVTLDDNYLDRIDQIVAELERAGLRVERVLATIGQVAGCTTVAEPTQGSIEDPCRERMTVITGVLSVDAVRQFSAPSPDSDVQ